MCDPKSFPSGKKTLVLVQVALYSKRVGTVFTPKLDTDPGVSSSRGAFMRLNSGLFGRFSAVVVFTAVALSLAHPAASATADKQLSRKSGQVAYKQDDNSAPKNIFGSQIVADDAYAVTGPKSEGQLRLADSSEIDID